MANAEKIIFYHKSLPNFIELLVNPETITLPFKKVLNRLRTKTRIVTLFWGEEPVPFNFQGQTGYTYPDARAIEALLGTQKINIKKDVDHIESEISKLEKEVAVGGPFSSTSKDLTGNINRITELRNQLSSINTQLIPIASKLIDKYNQTQLLRQSPKFKVLKELENLYRIGMIPSNDRDDLVVIGYRTYTLYGYFESFSYVDDAKDPWNFKYNIGFTVLDWEDNFNDLAGDLLEKEVKFITETQELQEQFSRGFGEE